MRPTAPPVTLGPVRTIEGMEEPADEAECWSDAMAGDARAVAALFDLHHARVYRYALRLLSDVHDAEDTTAGAFLELWRRRSSVRLVEGSVLPWLLVTTAHLSRNAARGLRRYRAVLRSLPRSDTVGGTEELAEGRIEASEAQSRVHRALRSLSKTDAALLAMTAFGDLTPSQAAAALGISSGAARTRLHRARARAAAVLGAPTGEGLPIELSEEAR